MSDSYLPGDDKFLMAQERGHFQPPSYNYEASASTISSPATSRYVMGDEERYPTVVETQLPPYIASIEMRSPRTFCTVSPLTATPPSGLQTPINDYAMSELSTNLNNLQKPLAPSTRAQSRICGVRRPIFLCVMAGCIATVIVGIIVGVVVGLKLRSKTTTRLPMITVSGVFAGGNNTDWNMQLYYTNKTTGDVNFRLNTDGATWGAVQVLNLSITPELDTSMSATSMLGTDGKIYLNLFYIKDAAIILANISCSSAYSCTTEFNDSITKNDTFPLSDDSNLAAVYSDSTRSFLVFYLNSDHYVTQVSSNPADGTWDRGHTISGKALAGSGIGAAAVGTNGSVNVQYVDSTTKTLYNVQWDTNMWWSPEPVTTITVPHWNPLTTLVSTWQPTSDILRAYFTGDDKFIYQFSGRNASTSDFSKVGRVNLVQNSTTGITTVGWTETPVHDLTWLPSDAVREEVAAVAWQDDVRFYRFVDGQVAESTLAQGVWSARFI